MRYNRALVVGLLFLANSVGAAPSAARRSQTIPITSRVEMRAGKRVGLILIGGQVAVRLKTVHAGKDPGERARAAAAKLMRELDDGVSMSAVKAVEKADQWTVSAGVTPFLFVTRREARAHDSDPEGLARRWSGQIRSLAALPAVKLRNTAIVVPLNETRSIPIGGWFDRSLVVGFPDGEKIAKAEVNRKSLIIRGAAPGVARVTVSAGTHSASCLVTVRKYAGNLKSSVHAQVTGRPAPAGLVTEAALLALRRFLHREPGAHLQLITPPNSGRSLGEGRKTALTARVRITGPNLLPVHGIARIEVENTRTPQRKNSQLMYSNVPEQIKKAGTLYFAEVPPGLPSRLFYHHINAAKAPAVLTVTLVNPQDKPVRLQIVPGFVFPHLDPVQAGRRAGRAFFPRYLKNIGEIYSLPARSAVPLAVDLLRPNEVGSGIAEVRLLTPESARCFIRVTASFKPADTEIKAAAGRLDAWRRVLPRSATPVELAEAPDSPDLFPTTTKQLTAEYTVGQKWTWIPFGKEPITDSAGTRRLEGNYGVLYNIALKVHNPGEIKRQVEVAFEAGAGPASGIFAIADQFVDIASIYPREEKRLARFTLGPNQTRTISIQTVPLGGSAYPASLIVR